MKNRSIFILLVVCTILLTACSQDQTNTAEPDYDALFVRQIDTAEDLVATAGPIVEVRKTGQIEQLVNQNAELTLTEVQVLRVVQGDPALDGLNIRILDLKSVSMGLFDKESHYLLFLYPQVETKIGPNVYSVVGEYQGKFKFKGNNKLFYDADKYGGIKTFQDEFTDLTLTAAADKIKSKKKLPR